MEGSERQVPGSPYRCTNSSADIQKSVRRSPRSCGWFPFEKAHMSIHPYTSSQNSMNRPRGFWCCVTAKPSRRKIPSAADPSPGTKRGVTPPTACTSANCGSFRMELASNRAEVATCPRNFTAQEMLSPCRGMGGMCSFQKCSSRIFDPAGTSPSRRRRGDDRSLTLTRNTQSGSSQNSKMFFCLRSKRSMARMMDRMVPEPVRLATKRGGDKPFRGKAPPSIPSRGVGSNGAVKTDRHASQHPVAER